MKKLGALILFGAAAAAGGAAVKHIWKQHYKVEEECAKKGEKEYQLFYHWLLLRQKNIGLDTFFKDQGIENIAVFDLSPQGRRFIDEIINTDIKIAYAIEKNNPAAIHEKLDVLRLHDDKLPPVDAVVVCSLDNFDGISAELQEELGYNCRIISLEKVIADTLEKNGIGSAEGTLNPMTLKH